MRLYLADFSARFHDIRASTDAAPLYDPDDYSASQQFARDLLQRGSNGVVYRSVRHPPGQCVACFRPPLVRNVRVGRSLRVTAGTARPEPHVRKL